MRVSHKYGPCSPLPNSVEVPFSDEILQKNEARVRWLNSRISNYGGFTTAVEEAAAVGPSPGQYLTTIGLGTPIVNYTMMIDTGSSSTWLRCKPCHKGCNPNRNLFDPSKSSTHIYTSEPFSMTYFDNSSTSGNWNYDTLKLDSHVINEFKFGCGQNNSGDFSGADGILGLGPGPFSLVSQLPPNIGKIFGYCLPKSNKKDGYFVIGDEATKRISSPTLKFTKLLSSSYYFVELLGISVAGT